jgi:hypothetical protein
MINAYCNDNLKISKWNGDAAWGEPVARTDIAVKGYIEYKRHLVRNARGEEVISSVMVYLPLSIESAAFLNRALSLEDRIKLDNDTFDRAIIVISRPKDFSRRHIEVYLA